MKAFYRKRTSGLNLNTEIVLFNLVYLNNARAICYDGENIIYNSFSWNHVFVINKYRLGTVNSNTVNSKFHLIRSFCEIFARFLSFHV